MKDEKRADRGETAGKKASIFTRFLAWIEKAQKDNALCPS